MRATTHDNKRNEHENDDDEATMKHFTIARRAAARRGGIQNPTPFKRKRNEVTWRISTNFEVD